MNVNLPDRWEPFLRSQVRSGRFASEGEVLDEALRRFSRGEQEPAPGNSPEAAAVDPAPAWQRVLDNMKDVPDEVFDRIPAASSEQLDHYIYGTPKRPAS